MATRHRIDEALTSERMGDVEKYFQSLTTMIDANSGVHDFKLLTADCSNVNAPVSYIKLIFFKPVRVEPLKSYGFRDFGFPIISKA